MRLLVAGGAGLLGAAVAARMLEAGHAVTAADAFSPEGDGRAVRGARASKLKTRGAAIRHLDLADEPAVRLLVEEMRPEAVVNAARLPADASLEPLLAALSALPEAPFLVHASDADLYGPPPELGRRATEDEPAEPGDDPRLLARAWDEKAVAESGLPFTILRVFELVSPDLPPGRFARELADAVLAAREIPLPDEEPRDFLALDDAARGVQLALARRPLGRTINLGSAMGVTLRELALEIARQTSRPARFVPTAPPPRRPRVADPRLAWDLLGFAPEVGPPGIAAALAASRAPDRPAAPPSRTAPAPAVSRRDLFGLFRRPFDPKK